MRLGVEAAVVDDALVPGDVEIADGSVAAVGVHPAGRGGVAVPGFVDLQVNGFGGVDFATADEAGYATAAAALAAAGVTSYQPTLVTAPLDRLEAALAVAARARARARADGRAAGPVPRILGVHLEGPFLSPAFAGAHDPRFLRTPDLDVAARLCGTGPVTHVTLAPELPGGFELLDWLVARGIVVSLGHTDADAPTAHRAFDRGARAVTHLHNAQRRFAARDPGVSGVALARTDVTVTAIVDLVHLAPETVLAAWRAARGRFALVTDAVAAAPCSQAATDAARLADGTLAGSVVGMDAALRNLVGLGVPLVDAVVAATLVPARLAGRPELGTLRPGTAADVVVLGDDLSVQRTVVAGVVC